MDPYPPASWEDDLDFRGPLGDGSSTHWHRYLASFAPTGSVETADFAYCHFDIAKVTNGTVDPSWGTTDFSNVATALGLFLAQAMTYIVPTWTYTGFKAYRKFFNTYAAAGKPEYAHDNDANTVWAPFGDMGAPIRVATANVVGTSTGVMPPQVACAVTNRNVKRRGWGRFYLPGVVGGGLDAAGGLPDAALSGLLGAYSTMITTMAGQNLHIVTPTTTNQAAGQAKGTTTPAFGLLQVSKIQVDSTIDVQRRRRHHVTRKVTALP